MQIVIEIPENDYNHIREHYEKNEIVEATYSYIYHGTVLPDNHGRLIDADALKDNINNWYGVVNRFGQTGITLSHDNILGKIDNAPTILNERW